MGGYSRRRKGGPWGVRLCGGVHLLEEGHLFKKIRQTGSFKRTWTKGICLHSSGGKFSLLIDIYIYSISYIFYTLYESVSFFFRYINERIWPTWMVKAKLCLEKFYILIFLSTYFYPKWMLICWFYWFFIFRGPSTNTCTLASGRNWPRRHVSKYKMSVTRWSGSYPPPCTHSFSLKGYRNCGSHMNLRVLKVMSNGFIILSNVFPMVVGRTKTGLFRIKKKLYKLLKLTDNS